MVLDLSLFFCDHGSIMMLDGAYTATAYNMSTKNKKIFLMICGLSLAGKHKDWLKSMPELGIIADVEPIFVFDQNSVDITPAVWIKLAQEIHQRMDQATGFVVLHSVDNLLYTAAALSFMLQNLTKPIIFTGGFFNETKNKKVDIRANLINASQAAGFNFSEVGIMFGNRLLRANNASRATDQSLNLFATPNNAILGRIDFSIRIFDKAVAKNKGKTKLYDELENNIEIVKIEPIINLQELSKRLVDKKGVIVKAGKYAALPIDLMFILEKLTSDIPIIIWSKVLEPTSVASKNILLVNNMTWESTLLKFMWALTQSSNIKKVKQLIGNDVAGEILE